MGWHSVEGVYIDERCCKFLEQYWHDIVLLAHNLSDRDMMSQASQVLTKTLDEIPLHNLQDPTLIKEIGQAFGLAGCLTQAAQIEKYLQHILQEQLDYYHTMPIRIQSVMPYTVGIRESLASNIF